MGSIAEKMIYPWTDIEVGYVDAKKGLATPETHEDSTTLKTGFLSRVLSGLGMLGITYLASRRFSTLTSVTIGLGSTYVLASGVKYGVTLNFKKGILEGLKKTDWDTDSAVRQLKSVPRQGEIIALFANNQDTLENKFLTDRVRKAMAAELNKIRDEHVADPELVDAYLRPIQQIFKDFVSAHTKTHNNTQAFTIPLSVRSSANTSECLLTLASEMTIKELRAVIFAATGSYPKVENPSVEGKTFEDSKKLSECSITGAPAAVHVTIPNVQKETV